MGKLSVFLCKFNLFYFVFLWISENFPFEALHYSINKKQGNWEKPFEW